MSKTLVIIGAGGHGRVVADAARLMGVYGEIVFFDDGYPDYDANPLGPVIGKAEDAKTKITDGADFIVAFGDAKLRQTYTEAHWPISPPVSILHPSAAVGADVEIGAGSMILAQTAINCGSRLGRSVIVNTGATIDHDNRLGDYAHISPGANLAGNVSVGDASWIGIGSCVKQSITIGAGVTIGAGAAVVEDIKDNQTAVGVPARVQD